MIGILTFYWADDYGALLQSYGMKTYLSHHQETIMIPYFPEELRHRYRFIQFNKKDKGLRKGYRVVRQIIGQISRGVFYSNLMAKCRISHFRKTYLTSSSRRLRDAREIYEFDKEIDTYVVGSDQVWNPRITEGLQEGYFCTFRQWKKERSRYVAYAASIGSQSLEEGFDEMISQYLTNFDAISLREPSAVPYMEKRCKKELEVVLDPVFLIGREKWEALIRTNRKRRKGYIAVYYTEYNQQMADYLKELEQDTGLYVLMLAPKIRGFHCTDNQINAVGCGPLEFLKYLHDAEYVVTNSFHGVAMSIIFQKQFAVFPHSVRNARLADILHTVHLEERIVGEEKGVQGIYEKIEWRKVEEALKEAVKHSEEFIEREILGHRNGNCKEHNHG